MPFKNLSLRVSEEVAEYYKGKSDVARKTLEDMANGKLVLKEDQAPVASRLTDGSFLEAQFFEAPECDRRFFTKTEPYCFVKMGLKPQLILDPKQCLICDKLNPRSLTNQVEKTKRQEEERVAKEKKAQEELAKKDSYQHLDRRVGSPTYGQPNGEPRTKIWHPDDRGSGRQDWGHGDRSWQR